MKGTARFRRNSFLFHFLKSFKKKKSEINIHEKIYSNLLIRVLRETHFCWHDKNMGKKSPWRTIANENYSAICEVWVLCGSTHFTPRQAMEEIRIFKHLLVIKLKHNVSKHIKPGFKHLLKFLSGTEEGKGTSSLPLPWASCLRCDPSEKIFCRS